MFDVTRLLAEHTALTNENAALRERIDALEAEVDLYKAWAMAATEIHPDLLEVFRRLTDEAKHISAGEEK